MSKKRIACDIDGVVANFLAGAVEYWGEPQIPVAYSLEEMFPHIPEEDLGTWVDLPSTYVDLPLVDGAREGISRLREAYSITFVTSRPEFVEDATVEWLEKQGLLGLRLIVAWDKAAVIEQYGFSVAIEDDLEMARRLAQFCPRVFLLNWPYNSGPCGRAMRVNDWEEIVTILGGNVG